MCGGGSSVGEFVSSHLYLYTLVGQHLRLCGYVVAVASIASLHLCDDEDDDGCKDHYDKSTVDANDAMLITMVLMTMVGQFKLAAVL